MAATRASVLKRAQTLGVETDFTEGIDYTIHAPKGFVFANTGLHNLGFGPDEDTTMPDVWWALMDDMSGGTKPCSDLPDCSYCVW